MRFFAGVVVTIVVIIIIGLIIIYSGWYNVSAANKEKGFPRWVLNTTMDNSVEKHAEGILVPALNSPEMIKEGFAHYNEMCKGCHGAPGKNETEIAKGLNPKAPDLSRSAKEMPPEELFWVTKNGIKMTGMPAWGLTHSDDKIWAMVAFLEQLPGMSGAEYDSMEAAAPKEDVE
ncbi:MAG TPA: cytochrome c [Ignavibacteriaceae bacterium]|jgi:mono/diheme cytochrome c family protein|nr:cytochrome c [Ignavibacteriaceae bacterium]